MSQNRLENWTKIRKKGQKHFVFIRCALGWGMITGVIWALLMATQQGWSRLPLLMGYALIAFPIGGLFMGWWTWRTAEKRYALAMQAEGKSVEKLSE
ncbi:MAG TPA: hypothetical protein VFY13_01815 [Luteolibacter sp.]|nr:hypothetical protein [Luteolibacter sp.]